jgi:hypothetical protein
VSSDGHATRDSAVLTVCSLKLQIYRSLGITATQDAKTGEFNRAVVRRAVTPEHSNRGKGDVNIINIDGELSQSFYCRELWNGM